MTTTAVVPQTHPSHQTREIITLDIPDVDLSMFRKRFIPQPGEIVTEDEINQRGACLVELEGIGQRLQGELIDWILRRSDTAEEESRNQIIRRYAAAWGTSMSTLYKHWVAACKFPQIARPEDMSNTQIYEILSGCTEPDEANTVFDMAIKHGWTVDTVREIKALREAGILSGWKRVQLQLDHDGRIYAIADGDDVAHLVGFLSDPNTDIGKAGLQLLRQRSRLREHWQEK